MPGLTREYFEKVARHLVFELEKLGIHAIITRDEMKPLSKEEFKQSLDNMSKIFSDD